MGVFGKIPFWQLVLMIPIALVIGAFDWLRRILTRSK